MRSYKGRLTCLFYAVLPVALLRHEALLIVWMQKSFYQRLTQDKKSDVFFRVFFEYIRQALQEIKTMGPVGTAETDAGKTSDEYKETGKEESKKKGNCSPCSGKVSQFVSSL